MSKLYILRLSLLFVLGIFSASVYAQSSQSYLNDTGVTPYGINIPVENGFINISNGNLHLEFPFASHPQRGALRVNERLVYDSRIWLFSSAYGSGVHWWPKNIYGSSDSSGGWRFVTGQESGVTTYGPLPSNGGTFNCIGYGGTEGDYEFVGTQYSQLIWTDPSGTAHPFAAKLAETVNDCTGQDDPNLIDGLASDGSGYSATDNGNGDWIIIDNTGTEVYPQTIDRFGNYWSADSNGNLIDDTGRKPVIVTQDTSSITYYDVLAPSGTKYTYNGVVDTNFRVRYTVTTAAVHVQTSFISYSISGIHSWDGYLYPVQSILLPDGSSYAFTYDNNGEVVTVALPTGGTIYYGYYDFLDSSSTENNWLVSRSLTTAPGMTFRPVVGTTCSNYSTGCKEYVTLVKQSGDTTLYELTLANGAWNTGTYAYTGTVPAYNGTIQKGAPTVKPLVFTTSSFIYSNACSTCQGANYITESLATTELFASGITVLETQAQSTFDTNGNPVSVKEWDYSSALSSMSTTTPPTSTPTRETDYTYTGYDLSTVTVLDSSGTQAGLTTYGYTSSATATSNIAQHGAQNAGGPYLQSVSHWLNKPNGASTTTYAMDDTGAVTSITDPNLNTTSLSYQCSNSLPFQVTNALSQVNQYVYDCSSGAIVIAQDPNDLAAGRGGTVYAYESTAGRIHSVIRADNGATTYSYPSVLEVDTATTATPDPTLYSSSFLDTFGRPSTSVVGGVVTDTTYDANSRVSCKTNPYVTLSTGSTCITGYDGLDRPLTEVEADGISTMTWSYAANATTFSDEIGNTSTRTVDSFGRLTSVVEPPSTGTGAGPATTYTYDGLGNVSQITQSGVSGDTERIRTFAYDSLSRLISSVTPEAGAVQIGSLRPGTLGHPSVFTSGYDLNGNLISKVDARGVITTYTYDTLNRLLQKTYSDGTAGSYLGYDGKDSNGYSLGVPNAVGRLSDALRGGTEFVYSYDPMGRLTFQQDCFPSYCFMDNGVTAKYDLAGDMTDLTYPDGRHIQQTWDAVGHLVTSGSVDIGGVPTYTSYVQAATYNPDGSPYQITLGNGVQTTIQKDAKFQPISLTVSSALAPFAGQTFLSHGYCYSTSCTASANNGNVMGIANTLQSANTQAFTYDGMNRIASFSLGGTVLQHYQSDSFGNLSPLFSDGNPVSSFDSATNRISNLLCSYSVSPAFDLAGNQLCSTDSHGSISQYLYDAENRVSGIYTLGSSPSSLYAAYLYSADGRRVRATYTGGPDTEYDNFGGETVAERDALTGNWTDYIYANGAKIARVVQAVPMLHFSGTNPVSGVECGALVDVGLNYSVQAGDMLSWMEYKNNAVGGLAEFFNGGVLANPWRAVDTNGITINQDSRENQWVPRTYDLSAYAGTSLTALTTLKDVTTPAGSWDIWYADIAILSTTGTVTTIMGSPGQVSASGAECQGAYSAVNIALESAGTAPGIVGSGTDTHFYVGDHLGTAQMELSSGGWPVWQGQYAPFGQEMDTQNTANNYRFTGLEYESLSELDHATFRQFSPVTTRWMSADPFGGSMDPSNPQSLNRYSYVDNMPMNFRDPSGLDLEGSIGGSGISFGGCLGAVESGGGNIYADVGCAWSIYQNFFHSSGHKIKESEASRPGAIWDEHGSYQAKPYTSAGDILGLTGPGCEFGACGGSFVSGQSAGPCGASNKDVCGSDTGFWIGLGVKAVAIPAWTMLKIFSPTASALSCDGVREATTPTSEKLLSTVDVVAAAAALKTENPVAGAAAVGIAAYGAYVTYLKDYCTKKE